MKTTNPLIIQAPEWQTLKQRYSSSLLTLFFWFFWFYLWQPIISLFGWLLGFKLFEQNMIIFGGLKGFLSIMTSYLILIFSMAVIFFGWAYYNDKRFSKKNRRGMIWKVSVDNLGDRFALSEDQVLECKTSRRLVIYFNETGKIIRVNNRLSRNNIAVPQNYPKN